MLNLRFYILFLCLFVGQLLLGQSGVPAANSSDAEIRKNTEALVSKYSLNADQAKQMYHVQVRKNSQIAKLADLQSSDLALYQSKYGSLQKGTWAGIRRILNTKAQVDIYQKTQNEVQALRKAKRKELANQKTSKEAIEAAVLAIYAE